MFQFDVQRWIYNTLSSQHNSQLYGRSPTSNTSQEKICIISINVKYPTTSNGVVDKMQCYHAQCGNSKVKIILFRSKIYQHIDLKELWSIFDQIRPIASNFIFHLQEKPKSPRKSYKLLKAPNANSRNISYIFNTIIKKGKLYIITHQHQILT